ncbi:hypothetical protein C9439_06295 [archaeon SCG-AAA382B04]|nr:hypothetical protein C9439_06295 [archaeon SCG-AAA382B04]
MKGKMKIKLAGNRKSKETKEIKDGEEGIEVDLSGEVKIRHLISKEDKSFKKGDSEPIKIKKNEIPKNHLLVISGYARQRNGHVIGVGENYPKPIEISRTVDDVLFAAGKDGEIEKNELIGIVFLFKIKE